jgi:hypothetical protein
MLFAASNGCAGVVSGENWCGCVLQRTRQWVWCTVCSARASRELIQSTGTVQYSTVQYSTVQYSTSAAHSQLHPAAAAACMGLSPSLSLPSGTPSSPKSLWRHTYRNLQGTVSKQEASSSSRQLLVAGEDACRSRALRWASLAQTQK